MFGNRSPGQSIAFDLWGQRGWARVEVAGEDHHQKDIEAALGTRVVDEGTQVEVTAQLVLEPTNRYDRNAVKVMVGPRHLGYLSKEVAPSYQPVLTALVERGFAPQCTAVINAWPDFDWDYNARGEVSKRSKGIRAQVRLDLDEPHMLVPANAAPPGAFALLPVGNAIQVTGEEGHMEALRAWTRPEGECWVHVTLHMITEQLARSSRTVVEVRIDDQVVGQLTPKMSGEYRPAIELLASRGRTTAARAVVKGNALKADVVLYAGKAGELDDAWISGATASSSRIAEAARTAEPEPEALPAQPSPAASTPAVNWAPPPAPPAWYPDPADSRSVRWWDGTSWTDHTHPAQ